MLRPPRDRQQCPTVSSPFARASSKRGGLFIFVMAAFALATILPSRAVSQTTPDPVPTGVAIIPTDLPAHASTAQTNNGPVSLLPGTIPANNAITEETEIPSLATQYHQTLTGTGTAPARPSRHQQSDTPTPLTGRQVQPAAKSLTPTVANSSSKETPVVKITAPVETAAPAPTGNHLIQLGAFRDMITAETYWASFRIRYPALAKTYGKQIIAADLGSQGIYHRLQLTGFVTPDSAKQQCRQLQADGTDCFTAN